MEYTYSIIIPHHNIPALLKRCLISIPRRIDLQIIVVDDHSNEQHLNSLQYLETEFPYVTFLYLPICGGGGKARNEGLKLAQGRYVLFADADDFFNYCIGEILEEYKDADYDTVYFNANSVNTKTYIATLRCKHLNKMIQMYEKNPSKAIFNLRYKFGEPWCKMVKRDIIEKNKICFSETIIHNDTRFSYLVGFYSSYIHVDNRAIFCVTDRLGRVSKLISKERLFVRSHVFSEATVFFYKHNIHLYGKFVFNPLHDFLLKGNWKNARKCVRIMKACGMSNYQIIYGFFLFALKEFLKIPFSAIKRMFHILF